MNQFDLCRIFDAFDDKLVRFDGIRLLKANDFMLVKLEASVAIFKHIKTGVPVKFDLKEKKILSP